MGKINHNFFKLVGEAVTINNSSSAVERKRSVDYAANRYRLYKLIETMVKKSAAKIRPQLDFYWERYGREWSKAHDNEQPVDGIQFVDTHSAGKVTISYNPEKIEELLALYNGLVGEEAQISEDDLGRIVKTSLPKDGIRINTSKPSEKTMMNWNTWLLAHDTDK